MDKNGMYEVSLDQALELLIRAAHQKDYDNVIYFATRIKEESKDWKRAPVQQTTSPTMAALYTLLQEWAYEQGHLFTEEQFSELKPRLNGLLKSDGEKQPTA